jgi:chromosome segregation ATPase
MAKLKPQYQDVLDQTAQAYRDALDRLVKGLQTHPDLKGKRVRITPTNVAREARRSRNPLYTTHKGILDEITAAAKRAVSDLKPATAEDKISELRETIKVLKEDKRKLASENAQLFYRATTAEQRVAKQNKEIEELRKKLGQLPVPLNRPRNV